MSTLPKSAFDITIKKLVKVRQIFPNVQLKSVRESVRNGIFQNKNIQRVQAGQRVAVLVGSRGISNLNHVVKSTVECLLEVGAKPFIVPAMGSHGGGIATMQKEIVEGYGITEKYTGVPIVSSIETVVIGHTPEGIPIHVDKVASEADAIVPIARVKVHTDYDAPIESGLCKMLAIGLGKHNGCSRLHQEGFPQFPKLIPQVASIIIQKMNIAFGAAIVENAHENLHSIHIVPGKSFLEEEPALLSLSKSLMPKLQFDEIDVLIVERMGKDISGAGMDPNIIGRMSTGKIPNFNGPQIKRILLLGISPNSHHNGTGCGLADFITRQAFEQIDLTSTYTNCIASGNPEAGKIPLIMENEKEGILAAIQTCAQIDPNDAKIVKIKDTLHLIDIQVSENLLDYCMNNNKFQVLP